MTQRRNQQQWQDVLDQQEISGLSGAEFCRQQQIDVCQFYYHSAQRRKITLSDHPSSAFLRAQIGHQVIDDEKPNPVLRLQHGSSELLFPVTPSPRWVAELMVALA
jgi:hypothetical protein